MIRVFNPTKLTGQPFFQDLLLYLSEHDDVTLRQIKRDFPLVKNIDRSIEEYVSAGYIRREQKRYTLSLPLVTESHQVNLDDHFFIETADAVYGQLLARTFETRLENQTNAAVLLEQTRITRDELTLSNYFYKLRTGYPMSAEQESLLAILGDVNPEYALKYLTSFLLKFERKVEVMQKRRDIFVDSLELLGYINRQANGKYTLAMAFDPETLTFTAQ